MNSQQLCLFEPAAPTIAAPTIAHGKVGKLAGKLAVKTFFDFVMDLYAKNGHQKQVFISWVKAKTLIDLDAPHNVGLLENNKNILEKIGNMFHSIKDDPVIYTAFLIKNYVNIINKSKKYTHKFKFSYINGNDTKTEAFRLEISEKLKKIEIVEEKILSKSVKLYMITKHLPGNWPPQTRFYSLEPWAGDAWDGRGVYPLFEDQCAKYEGVNEGMDDGGIDYLLPDDGAMWTQNFVDGRLELCRNGIVCQIFVQGDTGLPVVIYDSEDWEGVLSPAQRHWKKKKIPSLKKMDVVF